MSVVSLFSSTINVAVAANVSFVMEDLKEEFNKSHPDIRVDLTVGSSGKLATMISHGAPYHIYLSANMKYPETLYTNSVAITKPKVYAEGALVIISNKDINLSKGVNVVLDDKIKKIAIANPKTAPYGVATLEALKNANIYEKIKDRFIYGESISQTVMYATKMADLGFIAKSALYSPKMSHYKVGVSWVDLDPNLYTPIKQGIVILKEGKDRSDVKMFYDFLLSDSAKEIFKKFGYIVR
jgi:molybdate transport system substrate-binding protein